MNFGWYDNNYINFDVMVSDLDTLVEWRLC